MKKGFTLIEIIVVLSIITIVLLISFPTVKVFESIKTKATMDYAVSSTVEFLNGCKSFSRNKQAQTILLKSEEDKLNLFLNGRLVKSFELPDGTYYSVFNATNGTIEFDKFGYTAKACTIAIMDEEKNIKTITIKVGTAYVSEK